MPSGACGRLRRWAGQGVETKWGMGACAVWTGEAFGCVRTFWLIFGLRLSIAKLWANSAVLSARAGLWMPPTVSAYLPSCGVLALLQVGFIQWHKGAPFDVDEYEHYEQVGGCTTGLANWCIWVIAPSSLPPAYHIRVLWRVRASNRPCIMTIF